MATYKNIAYGSIGGVGDHGEALLQTITISSDATISFTTGIDSTYSEYLFEFINIHCETNDKHLTFQCSTNAGSSYGLTLTNTNFRAGHNESDSFNFFGYVDNDVAQGTSFAVINEGLGNADDASCSGTLRLYNPSSTTFTTHFMSRANSLSEYPGSTDNFVAGYVNSTSAVTGIRWHVVSSGTLSGTFLLYGLKDS